MSVLWSQEFLKQCVQWLPERFFYFLFFGLTTSHHIQLLIHITGATHSACYPRECANFKSQIFFFFFFAPRDGHKLFSVGCDYWHMLLPVMWKRVLRVDKVFACGWGRWRRRRGVTLLFISTLTNLPFSFKFPLLGRLLVWPHRSPWETLSNCLSAVDACPRTPRTGTSASLSPACLQKRPTEMPFFFFFFFLSPPVSRAVWLRRI